MIPSLCSSPNSLTMSPVFFSEYSARSGPLMEAGPVADVPASRIGDDLVQGTPGGAGPEMEGLAAQGHSEDGRLSRGQRGRVLDPDARGTEVGLAITALLFLANYCSRKRILRDPAKLVSPEIMRPLLLVMQPTDFGQWLGPLARRSGGLADQIAPRGRLRGSDQNSGCITVAMLTGARSRRLEPTGSSW